MAISILSKFAPNKSAGKSGGNSLRPDIQGLRAFAVIVVILDHMVGWPIGGFVGVDIFFVISGFVITASLLREHSKTGHISFTGFYRRRIKRILPASTLTLLVTVAGAYFLFGQGRFLSTATDAIWALFFSANWNFAVAGTDYFQSAGPVSPLQHFWSLAVEEQFYFVWPWVLLGILLLAERTGRQGHARTLGAAGIAVICAASFAWAMYESTASPTGAYFSTVSRAWELGIGALLAFLAPWASRIPFAARPFVAWAGAGGMFASLFVISSSSVFPAPLGLLPVLSAALFIFAGSGASEHPGLQPFTNPVSRYLGDISYSLYLWHFPVIVFAESMFPTRGAMFYLAVSAVIFAISAYAYHLLEDPVRKSRWLDPKVRRRDRQPLRESYKLTALSLLAIVTVSVVGLALYHPAAPSNATAAARPVASAAATFDVSTPSGQLSQKIQTALSATEWPKFEPAIANMADQRVPQWTENGCLDVTPANIDKCVYGNLGSTKTAVVIGDSIATSWLPAIIGALEPAGYRVQALTMQGCPIALTKVFPSQSSTTPYDACVSHRAWAAETVRSINPDLIILSDSALSLNRLVSKATGAGAGSEWGPAYTASIDALPTAKIVTLMTPPGAKNLQECYTPISKPFDCTGTVTPEWETLKAAESPAVTAKGGAFIDTKSWFCIQNACPAFAGNRAIYADSGHLTGAFSSELSPVVAEAFKKAGVPSL